MKREQNIGKHGENLAESMLHGLGLEFIEKVGTPVKLIPINANSAKTGIYKVIFGERVAADRRAMLPDGTSVLIEVKTILDRNLVWSDLREHQPGKLQQRADFNGLSLLVWVNDTVNVMRWPIEGFGPGKGITPARAVQLHVETVVYLQDRLAEIERDQRAYAISLGLDIE